MHLASLSLANIGARRVGMQDAWRVESAPQCFYTQEPESLTYAIQLKNNNLCLVSQWEAIVRHFRNAIIFCTPKNTS